MLASEVDLATLRYPVVASPKLDGIRCLIWRGKPRMRSLDEVPNKYINKALSFARFEGFDGELVIGPPTAKDVFNKTTGAVRRFEGEPDFKFIVFDDFIGAHQPYYIRRATLDARVKKYNSDVIQLHQQLTVHSEHELLVYEETCLNFGYEGLILRSPDAHYKFGRSTTKEQILLKLKRFTDAEAEIIDFEEQMHNTNEAKKNALGRTERSSAKDGLVGKETLGALIVRDLKTGVQFNIGTGMDDKLRQDIWKNRKHWRGVVIKYKYFKIGVVDAPRHPVYLGVRVKGDM